MRSLEKIYGEGTDNIQVYKHTHTSIPWIDPALGPGRLKRPKTEEDRKKWRKKLFFRGNFRQFSNKNVHIWDHFFPLLFPKDSESLKILVIRLREVGAKRPLNGTSKWTDTHTDRRTDGQTDISTYRKHRPRGPMLWKYTQCWFFLGILNLYIFLWYSVSDLIFIDLGVYLMYLRIYRLRDLGFGSAEVGIGGFRIRVLNRKGLRI